MALGLDLVNLSIAEDYHLISVVGAARRISIDSQPHPLPCYFAACTTVISSTHQPKKQTHELADLASISMILNMALKPPRPDIDDLNEDKILDRFPPVREINDKGLVACMYHYTLAERVICLISRSNDQ